MTGNLTENTVSPDYMITSEDSVVMVKLLGNWAYDPQFPEEIDGQLQQTLRQDGIKSVQVNMEQVIAWDSALLTVIISLTELCEQLQINFDSTLLPSEMTRMLRLVDNIPIREVKKHPEKNTSFLHNVGSNVIASVKEVGEVISFLKNAGSAFAAMVKGKAHYRSSDTWVIMQQTGAEALPIVSLLNFLVGAILGYIGAIQLEKFGAEIFIGDMVGVAMTREIAAIITAIIMAGRSGAAFAAQLGTMKVNEEIDALRSMGFSPIEFLVLPRMIGMMFMMPLLAIYANFMGIFGGAVVAFVVLNITLEQYLDVVIKSVSLNDVFVGITMSIVFGAVVAIIGCQKGMSCGNNAEAVGASTTSAVVTATVIIFVAAAILTVFFGVLGI